MKFGLREFDLFKSVSGSTSSQVNRAIKRKLIPNYGKRGIGLLFNPKKSIYNYIYSRITFGGISGFRESKDENPVEVMIKGIKILLGIK